MADVWRDESSLVVPDPDPDCALDPGEDAGDDAGELTADDGAGAGAGAGIDIVTDTGTGSRAVGVTRLTGVGGELSLVGVVGVVGVIGMARARATGVMMTGVVMTDGVSVVYGVCGVCSVDGVDGVGWTLLVGLSTGVSTTCEQRYRSVWVWVSVDTNSARRVTGVVGVVGVWVVV